MIGSFHSRLCDVAGFNNNAKLMVWTFNNAHNDWKSARKHHNVYKYIHIWSTWLRQSFSSIFAIIAIYFFLLFFFIIRTRYVLRVIYIYSLGAVYKTQRDVSWWWQCVEHLSWLCICNVCVYKRSPFRQTN